MNMCKNLLILFLQQLQRLLRSRNPEDLQAANRLIKNMVREVIICYDLINHMLNFIMFRVVSGKYTLSLTIGLI